MMLLTVASGGLRVSRFGRGHSVPLLSGPGRPAAGRPAAAADPSKLTVTVAASETMTAIIIESQPNLHLPSTP